MIPLRTLDEQSKSEYNWQPMREANSIEEAVAYHGRSVHIRPTKPKHPLANVRGIVTGYLFEKDKPPRAMVNFGVSGYHWRSVEVPLARLMVDMPPRP